MTSNLAVIIPAYNESNTIYDVVKGSRELGDVVVVDDGSRDETASFARAAGAYVISLSSNQGYEAALAHGIQFAIDQNYEFAITMDADAQHRIESARSLISAIGSADIVVGTRRVKQRISEWIAGWIAYLLWKISDPFSGLKLYRIATCRLAIPFDSHKLIGAEMMIRALRLKLNVKTISISTNRRADSPRFGSAFRANIKMLRAIFIMLAIYFGYID